MSAFAGVAIMRHEGEFCAQSSRKNPRRDAWAQSIFASLARSQVARDTLVLMQNVQISKVASPQFPSYVAAIEHGASG